MKDLLVWVPTFTATTLLAIAGFVLHYSIKRDERRQASGNPRHRENSP